LALLDFIIDQARHAAAMVSIASLILVSSMFYVSGTPLYLISAQRRSLRYGQALVENRVLDQGPEDWLRPTHGAARSS
jgi:hypothetical protein